MKYDFQAIEKKWQARWEKEKPFAAVTGDPRPKFYGLIEFPYPSGQGLHVGHPRPFTAMDIICRKRRMQGYNVLFPIGFDAFGLPTENYAIKNHIHPAVVTKNNIANFTKQLKMLGYSFDWDRAVDTTDPSYYKWTQWIFLQMYKHGLAYKTTMPVNWCTSCKCVLANEEVVNGVCERCGSEVVRKEKSQWMLAITKYAQRLIDDLDDVDYIERVKTQQRNWIGRSTGAEITFKTNVGDDITVYTTRADTLFGTTYMVISPEHPLLKQWQPHIANWDAVAAYQEEAAHKSDFERGELNKEKTGVRLEGIEVMNPVTHKALPMFVSDYVLMGYGTGVVSASSDHLVIRVEGRGGHGAHPQSTVDPINIGVHIHLALQELLSREADPAELVVLTFGKFQGGDAANIIPSSAVLEGTLRTFSEPLRTHLLERIDTICTCTAEAFRGRAQVTDLCSTCSLQIDGDTAAAVAQGWQREGLKMLQRGEKMSGSEDFAEIAARVPSTFFVVGGGTAQDGCGVSLHNPKIRFREEALIYGAAAYASGAAMWLELH